MPKLLRLDFSPRGDWSISKNIADAVEKAWVEKFSGEVTRRDYSKGLPVVDLPWIAGAYTSPDQQTAEHKAALKVSDETIAELKGADHVLIAAPFWNFGVPASLKSWIDQIVRINVTFSPSYEGLVTGKKLLVVRASGGAYSEGSPRAAFNNFDKPLLDPLALIGIQDATIYAAEDTRPVIMGQQTMAEYLAAHSPNAIKALLG